LRQVTGLLAGRPNYTDSTQVFFSLYDGTPAILVAGMPAYFSVTLV